MVFPYTFQPFVLLRVTPAANRNSYRVARLVVQLPRVAVFARNPGLGKRNSYRVAAACGLLICIIPHVAAACGFLVCIIPHIAAACGLLVCIIPHVAAICGFFVCSTPHIAAICGPLFVSFPLNCCLRTPLVNTWTGWTPLPLLAPTVGLCFTPFAPYYIIMRATVMAGAIFS